MSSIRPHANARAARQAVIDPKIFEQMPGRRWRAVLAVLLPGEMLGHVIDPILADLHAEWCDSPEHSLERARAYLRFARDVLRACAYLMVGTALRSSRKRVATTSGAAIITLSLYFVMQSLIAAPATPLKPQAPPLGSLRITPPWVEPPPPKRLEACWEAVPERPGPLDLPETTPPVDFRSPPSRNQTPFPKLSPLPNPGPPRIAGFSPDLRVDTCLPSARVEPEYPMRARERGIVGKVWVELEVQPNGSVDQVRILDSPHPLLSRATERAVRKWRYRPSRASEAAPERSACGTVQVVLTFELPE